ncbi:hypothetical protein ACJJTC_010715 [Scirpophaga incertulas]
MREPEAPSGWPRAAVPATWLPELVHEVRRDAGAGGAQRVAEGGAGGRGRRCRPRGYLSSCTRCAVMREPEAPSGWPRAAVPATWLPELVHEVRRDAGAGGAQRVAEGGGAGHVAT